ncbi:centrosomal protein 15 kDa isoform X2 [Rhineura floridana]|uniref:centrosomal protein 15 kDa isoform X2 n=1 Tax=Rhineura floridana TaxID=261503 RepID=UPI002AC874FD|nr:centrosomal protein 15 kDa isoform X2 [Rhineura floridana]
MASFLAQEDQLAKRHEEILSQRLVLLQQMANHQGDKEAEKTWQMQEADAAHKRNVALLNKTKIKRSLRCLAVMTVDLFRPRRKHFVTHEPLPLCGAFRLLI